MKYRLVLLILSFFLIFPLFAQNDVDSLFRTAIGQSIHKDYQNALLNAKKVLDTGKERSDVLIFIANVYAWQQNFDSSKVYLQRACNIDPENTDLYDSWLNTLLWNDEYEEILKTVDTAISHNYNNAYNIITKRLIAFKNLRRYPEAIALCEDKMNQAFLDSAQVKSLYREILLLWKQNVISVYYSLDYLRNADIPAQHLASVDYGHRLKQNSFLMRLNYGNRYHRNNVQIESDLYLTGKKSSYFYLNYGYSFTDIIFPRHRAGAEYFFHLKRSFEASVGGRYLYFTGFPAEIFTGSLSKYYKSFMFSLRPYYSINKYGNSVALSADLRKYDKLPLSYWNIEFGYGNSPDERFIVDQEQNYLRLDSYRVKISRNLVIAPANELKLVLGYAYGESPLNYNLSRYILELTFRFKL